MNKNTFSKIEHLCGEKRLSRVFTQGKAFIVYPMRIVYIVEAKTDIAAANILVSVPKKRFKRAVKRNRLKRLMREAYRINKHELTEILNQKDLHIHLAFNYVADDEKDFEIIEMKMKLALEKIIAKINSEVAEVDK